MPRHVLIVVAHPDPSPDRLCRALANAYAEGAEQAGHTIRRVDLASVSFPLLRTMNEFEHGNVRQAADRAVRSA
jgi:putative NADPH-quinone reductase